MPDKGERLHRRLRTVGLALNSENEPGDVTVRAATSTGPGTVPGVPDWHFRGALADG
jgi:hypothetical protein